MHRKNIRVLSEKTRTVQSADPLMKRDPTTASAVMALVWPLAVSTGAHSRLAWSCGGACPADANMGRMGKGEQNHACVMKRKEGRRD